VQRFGKKENQSESETQILQIARKRIANVHRRFPGSVLSDSFTKTDGRFVDFYGNTAMALALLNCGWA